MRDATIHFRTVIVHARIVGKEMIVNVRCLMQPQEDDMNIYDTKQIRCAVCKKAIGEIDYDAEIFRPKCGQCANPTPHPKDKMNYLISH